jgi:hypothetical protein
MHGKLKLKLTCTSLVLTGAPQNLGSGHQCSVGRVLRNTCDRTILTWAFFLAESLLNHLKNHNGSSAYFQNASVPSPVSHGLEINMCAS